VNIDALSSSVIQRCYHLHPRVDQMSEATARVGSFLTAVNIHLVGRCIDHGHDRDLLLRVLPVDNDATAVRANADVVLGMVIARDDCDLKTNARVARERERTRFLCRRLVHLPCIYMLVQRRSQRHIRCGHSHDEDEDECDETVSRSP